MLLAALILGALAALANAAALSGCRQCWDGAPDFTPYLAVYFLANTGPGKLRGPCEKIMLPDGVQNSGCIALTPGCVASQANEITLPAGGWRCHVFLEATCSGAGYAQEGSGLPLPEEFKGRLGSFYCERKDGGAAC